MLFSKLYPFLRTKKAVYLPCVSYAYHCHVQRNLLTCTSLPEAVGSMLQELDSFYTYPTSILSQKLYLGSSSHRSNTMVVKDLKITSFVDCLTDGSCRLVDEE